MTPCFSGGFGQRASTIAGAPLGTVASIVSSNQDWVSTLGGDSVDLTCTGVVGTPVFSFGGTPGVTTLVVGNICTVTVPLNASAGVVNITAPKTGGGTATLTNGAEYMIGAQSTLQAWHDKTVLSPFAQDSDANGTVTVSTDFAPPGSTRVIKCQRTQTGTASGVANAVPVSKNIRFDQVTYPDFVFCRFRVYIPTATINSVTGSGGQIKFFLFRQAAGGSKDSYMLGFGTSFSSSGSATDITVFSDWDTGTTVDQRSHTNPGDGIWTTILVRLTWDGTLGHGRICFNGKELVAAAFANANAMGAGTDYGQQLGIAFANNNSVVANVYIADILTTHGLPLASAVA